MIHVACESELRSVVRSSMYPCLGNWMAIGRAVVYYASAARTFSIGTVSHILNITLMVPLSLASHDHSLHLSS